MVRQACARKRHRRQANGMAIRQLVRSRLCRKTVAIFQIVLAIVIPCCFALWFEVQKRIPVSLYWRAELAFLISVEIAYVVALFAAGVTVPVLGVALLAARRLGRGRPWMARWLLCAG